MVKKSINSSAHNATGMGSIGDDDRFSAMHTAPTFKKTSKDSNKVKLDDRFGSVMTESRFQGTQGKVDKYGRSTKTSKKKSKKEMGELYADKEIMEKKKKPSEDRIDYLNRIARGEGGTDSSSDSSSSQSSDSDNDSDSDSDTEININAAATKKGSVLDVPVDDEEEVEFGEATKRLAIMHCEWEHMKAMDLFVVLQSFCPPNGKVIAVTVYPSDYGLEEIAKEEALGPQGIWSNNTDNDNAKFYSGIVGNLEEDASEGGSSDGGNEDVDEVEDTIGKSKKSVKGADFTRKSGSVGLVSGSLSCF
jgi:hypothetical protein